MWVPLNIPHSILEIGTTVIPSLYLRRLRLAEVKGKAKDKWPVRGRPGFEHRLYVSRFWYAPFLGLPERSVTDWILFFLILGMRVNFNNSSHVKKSKSTMSTFLCVQNEKTHKDFPGNQVVKNPIWNAGDRIFDPWSGNQDPTCHRAVKPGSSQERSHMM